MREDSYSGLFGRGPAAARARAHREQLNSGVIDLQSLYTTELERMQALGGEPLLVMPMPEVPLLPPVMRAQQATAMDAYEVALTRRIPRPIGWYAVFVTWLATVTLAAAATTQVPAHVRTRVHPMVAAAAAATPATAAATAPAMATAAARATTTTTATATATATAIPTPTATSSVPLFLVSDLPQAQTKAAPPALAKWVARTKRRAAAARVPAPPPAPTPTPAPTPASVAAAPPPPPAATTAAPVAATPLSNGGTLEDLIRREVAAEQKKIRAAKAQ